jgi:hypothetical protein
VSLAATTELDVNRLDDQTFQASLPQGEVYLDLRNLNSGDTYQITTPRGTAMISQPGRYEVASGDQAHAGMVTVLEGAAQVSGDNLNLAVGAGQAAVLSDDGNGGPVQASVTAAQGDDQLIAWARSREPREAPPQAAVGMTGTQDLAQYGRWSTSPDYGAVWYPQVAADWVPYRAGHWAWVAPWGWTWVDDAPWGFAPFHYGRWVQIGPRWAWAPRPIVVVAEPVPVVPVYAPALVSFIGNLGGVGIGISIGGPSVGWVPLGPREVYYPTFRVSRRYARNVNITYVKNVNIINEHNTTIVNNITVNHFANHNAMTVVSRDAMLQSRHVPGAMQRVNPRDLDAMRGFAGGQPPLRPTAQTAGLTPEAAKEFGVSPQQIQHKQAAGPMIQQGDLGAKSNRHTGDNASLVNGAGSTAIRASHDGNATGASTAQNSLLYQAGTSQQQDRQSKQSRWPSEMSRKPGASVQLQELPQIGASQAQHNEQNKQAQAKQVLPPPSGEKTSIGKAPQVPGQQQRWLGQGGSVSRLPGAPVTQGQGMWQQDSRQHQQKQSASVQQINKQQHENRKSPQSDWQQMQRQQNTQMQPYQVQQGQSKQQRAQGQQQRPAQQQQVLHQQPQGQQYQPRQVQHANRQGTKVQPPTTDQLLPQQ